MSSKICNTYILNSATVKAIPFLLELLESDKIQDKQRIINILRHCSQEIEPTCENLVRQRLRIVIRVGRKIASGLEIYISLIDHPDKQVRIASLWLLIDGKFPRHNWIRIHQVYEEYKQSEKHPDIVQHFKDLDRAINENKPLHIT